MNSSDLRDILTKRAEAYARKKSLPYYTSKGGVVIFKEKDGLNGNFLPASYKEILKNNKWAKRLNKEHTHKAALENEAMELDSCMSSDALLMNIFSHPKIDKWKSVKDLFSVDNSFGDIVFGEKAELELENGNTDRTEIDLKTSSFIAEAKLTETSFTRSDKSIVENYKYFKDVFEPKYLQSKTDDSNYDNYQLIRNILALKKYQGKNFYLICDFRRSDLIKEFVEAVKAIKDESVRQRCNIVFWQEIKENVGKDLKDFLEEKYGL